MKINVRQETSTKRKFGRHFPESKVSKKVAVVEEESKMSDSASQASQVEELEPKCVGGSASVVSSVEVKTEEELTIATMPSVSPGEKKRGCKLSLGTKHEKSAEGEKREAIEAELVDVGLVSNELGEEGAHVISGATLTLTFVLALLAALAVSGILGWFMSDLVAKVLQTLGVLA